MNWQSSRVKLPALSRATSQASATFDASVARLNMLSPKKARPSCDAVEAADERAAPPHLDRMGVAAGVERDASRARSRALIQVSLAVGAAATIACEMRGRG